MEELNAPEKIRVDSKAIGDDIVECVSRSEYSASVKVFTLYEHGLHGLFF